MRLIDADALPIKFDGHTVGVWKNDLDATPTIDAAPIVHARWYDHGDGSSTCTACRRRLSNTVVGYPRCPNCGARMDAKEDKPK